MTRGSLEEWKFVSSVYLDTLFGGVGGRLHHIMGYTGETLSKRSTFCRLRVYKM